MGQSLPPPARFDLVSSYARVRGDDVEIVIVDPPRPIARRHPTITLRRGGRRVDAPGEKVRDERGLRVVARVPRVDLVDGTWSLTLRPGAGPVPLEARLLVQGQRPVVLLWGAEGPKSRLPDPRPADAGLAGAAGAARPVERARSVARRARSLSGSLARRVRARAR